MTFKTITKDHFNSEKCHKFKIIHKSSYSFHPKFASGVGKQKVAAKQSTNLLSLTGRDYTCAAAASGKRQRHPTCTQVGPLVWK